mmetsp:Transcript_5207/g.15363  ORF Transcript_5207/g.15363 Transcript_5207/m.15363 type:complete len:143 (-) Transcript_5207:266-694(-)
MFSSPVGLRMDRHHQGAGGDCFAEMRLPLVASFAGEGGDSSRHGDWSRTSSEKTIDHVATPRRRLGKAGSSLAPTLPGGVPAMPQLPKGRGELLGHASPGHEASQEASPRRSGLDWGAAVARMSQEGVIRSRPRADAAPLEL